MPTWTINGRTWGYRQSDVPGQPYFLMGAQVFKVWHILMADVGAAVGAAAASAASAAASVVAVAASATTATNQATAAGTARTGAETARDQAQTSATAAGGSATAAGTAKAGAETARDQAQTARDQAQNSATAAGTATAEAETARDQAQSFAAAAGNSAGAAALAVASVPDIAHPYAEIKRFWGPAPPAGWLLCDGSAVSRTTYAALFAAIGTSAGVGDESTTFNLPKLRTMRSAVPSGGHITETTVVPGTGITYPDPETGDPITIPEETITLHYVLECYGVRA